MHLLSSEMLNRQLYCFMYYYVHLSLRVLYDEVIKSVEVEGVHPTVCMMNNTNMVFITITHSLLYLMVIKTILAVLFFLGGRIPLNIL
jgi:hypothetical protein